MVRFLFGGARHSGECAIHVGGIEVVIGDDVGVGHGVGVGIGVRVGEGDGERIGKGVAIAVGTRIGVGTGNGVGNGSNDGVRISSGISGRIIVGATVESVGVTIVGIESVGSVLKGVEHDLPVIGDYWGMGWVIICSSAIHAWHNIGAVGWIALIGMCEYKCQRFQGGRNSGEGRWRQQPP